MNRPTPDRPSLLDPLISRALCLFSSDGRTSDVDEVAGQLLADELLASSSYEVGTWGQPIFKAAAEAAARVRRVAVGGDEVPLLGSA
jgi:hypothetical protein